MAELSPVVRTAFAVFLLSFMTAASAVAQTATTSSSTIASGPLAATDTASPTARSLTPEASPAPAPLLPDVGGPDDWTKPDQLSSTLQVMLLLTVVSLAPAVLLMTTSFVRIVVVLGLLRQALGTQQLPPSQVITSVALFVTLLLMAPVWQRSYDDGIKPYTDGEIGLEEAFERGVEPIRRFMADQIHRTENDDDVFLFLQYLPEEAALLDQAEATGADGPAYAYYDLQPGERIVPLQALLPAFMLSELKTAFVIGFQIYLPFVILDIVVASVTISMGMLMLPPVLISLPFKLLLFVLLDGWRLVIEMLLQSFTVFV
ncbi:MAG: flagellar type III secretion system pore protein FliP [Planctomycetota bacterium]